MIIELQELAVIDKNVMDIAKTGMSDPCEPGSIVVASETLAPSAPTFSIAIEPGALVLTLTRPTTKTDGTALTNFREFAIYHSTGSGIDISDDGTYDGVIYSSATSITHECSVETFFKVTALNAFSVESLPSAEDSETPSSITTSADIPTVATGLVFDGNPIIGDGIIGLLILDPATTWALFSYWEIQFALSTNSGADWGAWTALTKTTKFGYLHKGISIAAGYRYKYRGRPVGENGTASTTWDTSDNSGDGWPNAGTWSGNNSAVVAETVLAENIIALNEVRAGSIKVGVITADKLAFTAYIIGTNSIDDIGDGITYSKVLKTDITAGHILLSEATGDLDNIGDGATYSRVKTTDITAGHILLSEATGDLHDIADGGGYSKVATTEITAGKIVLVASTASININSAVFEDAGIQLQYNAGTPQFYVGDGANEFIMLKASKLQWKAANTELDASGNLIATSATLSGAVTAMSGAIGGWTLGATTLVGGDLTLDSGNTKISAGTGDDIIIIDAADANYRLVIGDAVYANAPFSVQKDGKFYLGGASGNLQWTPSPASLIVTAIYASAAASTERITIEDSDLKAVDASDNTRINFSSAEIRIYESDGSTTLSIFPSTPATVAHIGNDEVIIDNTLIVGRSTDPSTADKLHVTGTGLFTSTVVVGDHGESTTPSVANVLFYTAGNIPDADTTPRGTLAVQVPA